MDQYNKTSKQPARVFFEDAQFSVVGAHQAGVCV